MRQKNENGKPEVEARKVEKLRSEQRNKERHAPAPSSPLEPAKKKNKATKEMLPDISRYVKTLVVTEGW